MPGRKAYSWFIGLLVLLATLLHSQSPSSTGTQAQPTDAPSPSPQAIPSPLPDSTQLEAVKAPQPDYPLEAAAKAIQGKVIIQLHISAQGDVTGTEILEGNPVLAEAAEKAMKEWKFKPFIKDGVAVNVSRKVPFDFVLHGTGCGAVEAALRTNLEHHHDTLIPSGLMEGKLTHRVEPAYPVIARLKRIQGDVVLQAKIGQDGRIVNLQALCGAPELIPSSLEAVKHWRYSPFLLNGAPVAVQTTIKVQFRM